MNLENVNLQVGHPCIVDIFLFLNKLVKHVFVCSAVDHGRLKLKLLFCIISLWRGFKYNEINAWYNVPNTVISTNIFFCISLSNYVYIHISILKTKSLRYRIQDTIIIGGLSRGVYICIYKYSCSDHESDNCEILSLKLRSYRCVLDSNLYRQGKLVYKSKIGFLSD